MNNETKHLSRNAKYAEIQRRLEEAKFPEEAAFPRPCVGSDAAGTVDSGAVGMSLRDYFAGEALRGMFLVSSSQAATRDPALIYAEAADGAYKYADAMLRARQQKGGAA